MWVGWISLVALRSSLNMLLITRACRSSPAASTAARTSLARQAKNNTRSKPTLASSLLCSKMATFAQPVALLLGDRFPDFEAETTQVIALRGRQLAAPCCCPHLFIIYHLSFCRLWLDHDVLNTFTRAIVEHGAWTMIRASQHIAYKHIPVGHRLHVG